MELLLCHTELEQNRFGKLSSVEKKYGKKRFKDATKLTGY
jgi:hypothetical protein